MKTNYWMQKIGGSEFKLQRLQDKPQDNSILDNPENTFKYITNGLNNSIMFRPDVENFIVIHLNSRNKPIGFEILSTGTLDTLLVHPREVFKSAIVANSHGIILCHNHPSGDSAPSEADIKVTRDLIRASQLLKIEVLDHIVLGRKTETDKGYCSLRELGYFYT
jgi:DNA repair protein RadC